MRPPTLSKLHKEGIDLTFRACALNDQIATDGVYAFVVLPTLGEGIAGLTLAAMA